MSEVPVYVTRNVFDTPEADNVSPLREAIPYRGTSLTKKTRTATGIPRLQENASQETAPDLTPVFS